MEQISRRHLLTVVGGLSGAVALAGCAEDEEPSLADEPSTSYDWADDSDTGDGSSSAEDDSPDDDSPDDDSQGGLTEVALGSPDELKNRWAAYVATWIGADLSGGQEGPRVEAGDWIYTTETGEWAWLVRFKDGRAVLTGQGEPDTRRGDAEEKKARKALVEGAPTWWKTYEKVVPEFNSVGFVLGWDGKRWQRVSGTGGGGFEALTFSLSSEAALGEQLASWGTSGKERFTGSTRTAAVRVMRSGPKVTVPQLRALGPGMKTSRLTAAVKAAKAFETKGKH